MTNQKKFVNVLVPICSIILGFLIGAIVILAIGKDPIEAYQALFESALGSSFGIGQVLRIMAPLIFTALGFSVAYKAGFFNIGLAGQALCGWLVSVWVAFSFATLPQYILLPLCIVSGALAGALWAGIAGVLKAFFNTSEVITTIMLNYTIVYITDFLIRNVLTNPPKDATDNIPEAASLKFSFLTELTDGSTLHAGIFLALIAAVVIHILFKKTILGFELRAVGQNAFAAEYAGMNAKKNIIISMLISGLLAGLGGVMEGLGQFGGIFLQNGAAPSIGFDGMAVALLGLCNPLGIVLSAGLFGIFEAGRPDIAEVAAVPTELVSVVTAVIIFFVGASYIIKYVLEKMSSKKAEVK